jgi:hypothetical protein
MVAIVDVGSPTANMYGCEPCPKCGGKFRAPYKRGDDLSVECDDCDFKEPGERTDDGGDE